MNRRSSYKFSIEQYPALRLGALFILGIVCARLVDVSLINSVMGLCILFLLFVGIEVLSKTRTSLRLSRAATILSVLVVISSGFVLSVVQNSQLLSGIEKLISISDWEEVTLKGSVVNKSKNSSGDTRLDLAVSKVELKSGLISNTGFKARILWDVKEAVDLGNVISAKGTIIPISEPRNPSVFNYKKFLASRNIHTQIRIDSVLSNSANNSTLSWITVRKKALSIIDSNFNGDTAPTAKALLLGYKNELETTTRQAFARTGLSHIMAVSGLHVGLVVAPFWIIIPFFWTKKHGTKIGLIILVSVLFFYAGITGFSSSVVRASVMAILLTYGKLFSKRSDSINLMGVAAFIILLFDPNQLFEIGFQLSFSAVLIILLILPVIQNSIPYWVRIKWYGTPVMVVIISLVVQLGLYPLQAYYFGEVSIISPLANALFVPLLGLIVPLSLLSLIISSVAPSIGFFFNYPSVLFLNVLHEFVDYSSALSWVWINAEKPSLLVFPFWVLLVLAIGSWRNPAIKWKMVAGMLVLFVLVQSEGLKERLSPETLLVTVFDVGQGDASLIRTPLGKHILIDTGTWSPQTNSGSQLLLPYFKQNNIKKLDAVILSHPHADHIGGILELLSEIEIDTIYNSGYKYDSRLYHSYISLAAEKETPVVSLTAGDQIIIDPTILILALGPEGEVFNNDPNQHSVVLNVIYGKNKFLFTGDAGENQEHRLVQNYDVLLDTDFLKVGHHGSRTSSESFFLNEVSPEISVVSLANKNRFNHPHQEAVLRLSSSGSKIYFTGRDRALVFESNGKIIRKIDW